MASIIGSGINGNLLTLIPVIPCWMPVMASIIGSGINGN